MPNTLKVALSAKSDAVNFSGSVLLLIDNPKKLGTTAAVLDKIYDGRISAALAAAPRFQGKLGERLTIVAPAASIKAASKKAAGPSRIILMGIGTPETEHDWTVLGGKIYTKLAMSGDANALLIGEGLGAEQIGHIALGLVMRSYRFDKYKTRLKDSDKPALKKVTIGNVPAAANKALATNLALAEGIELCRELGNEPPNVLNPETAAAKLKSLAKLGIKVTVVDDKQMAKLGMGCMLAVGAGSETPPRLVVMEYRGAKNKKAAPLALVGKGITFDTGGINIKLEMNSLHNMRYDMMGAANVAGVMYALAKRKARVNVVGVAAFAENMLDEDSYRPSDILKSMAGLTVDVWNTDAEGRLVLCDAMWYVQEKCKPHTLLDIATLTGATIIALAHEYAVLCANDDTLANRICAIGQETGERFWRMPTGPEFDKYLKSPHADLRNVTSGAGNRAGGSVTAARFLEHFVQKGVKWAHMDIANVAATNHDDDLGAGGPTAYGVRMLNRLIAEHYED